MSAYLSHSQALEYVQREAGLSRETFDLNIRPRLLERSYGERVKRFRKVAIEQAISDPSWNEQEGSMFAKKKTVKDALDHTWETVWQFQKGSRQQKRLKDTVAEEIGDKVCKRLKYDDLEDWVLALRKRKLKEATIARRLATLLRALKVAKVKGWIEDIPDRPPLSVDNAKDRFITYEEESRLFDAIKSRSEIAQRVMPHVLGFLLDTGCRLSELIRLRPDCVLSDGVLFKDRKTGGTIKVPLTARARIGITELHRDGWWQHWTRNVNDSDKDTRDKAIETIRTRLCHEFTSIRGKAGIHDISLHTCRHTVGSRLAQAGYPMHKIQQMLGHRDITVTSRLYAHLAPDSLSGAAALLERRESNNVIPLDRQRINED